MHNIIKRAFRLRGVLTLLGLIFALQVQAQNLTTGTIVDENDQPAIEAMIGVVDTTEVLSTDTVGHESQEIPVGAQTESTESNIKPVPAIQEPAQKLITGKIVDENDQPAIGAMIGIVGTNEGASTDLDGNFKMTVEKGAVIAISYIGYESQEIPVGTQTEFNIKLVPAASFLEEVVVVGYGVVKRSDLTGAVASVGSDDIEGYKSASVLEAIGGKIAGVQVISSDGSPGGGFDIRIRGVGTLSGESGPLYIVDGFQVDNIDYLSNSDIESINVLKDASSAAIYGSRAANGVVLVTTKSGKKGRAIVTYDGSANYREISRTLEQLTPQEFVALQLENGDGKFKDTYFKDGSNDAGIPHRYQSLDDYANVAGVDWQGETFNPTWSQDHNVSLSGGSDQSTYAFSFGNYSENGIFANSSFDKTTAKMRITQKIVERITLDASINYSNTNRRGVGTSADDGRFNMLGQILRARPTGGLRMTDDELLAAAIDPEILAEGGSIAQVNPIVQAQSVDNNRRAEMWGANLSLAIDLGKCITFRTAGTYNTTNNRNDLFYNDGSKEAYRNGQSAYGQTTTSRTQRWSNNNTLQYKLKGFDNHSFDAMLGHEIDFRGEEFLLGGSKDFPFDNIANDNLSLGATPTTVGTGYSEQYLLSFFLRVNYIYKERYIIIASVRADGSSKFGDNNKWGIFPSVSAAWRISKEDFMKQQDVVSDLKLRAGWGVVGNDRIPSFLDMDLFSRIKYGYGNGVVTGLIPKQLPNPDLKWEGSTTTNIGVDLGLFDGRLNLTVDYFIKDTKDLLMEKNLAYVSGFTSQWQNIGKIRNSGLELNISSVNLDTKGGFFWTTDFNISFIKNELLELQDGQTSMFARAGWNSSYSGYDYIATVGQPLGNMYGYVYDGVYQESDFIYNVGSGGKQLKPGVADISNHFGEKGRLEAGMAKYKDIDGDGVITTKDRTVIGNGTPDWYGGITNTFMYKGIDFSFMFQFSYGNEVYNATRMYGSQSRDQRANMLAEVADRWTPTNASNEVPSYDGYKKDELYSRFIEDGSFLRLKNVSLGYTLPGRWTEKFFVSKLRLYVTAQNLFTVTEYSGYDPEVSMRSSNPMTPSLDWGAYPKSRVYTFGINVIF